jgi:hypothetical protein
MADKTVLQKVAAEAVELFSFIGKVLGEKRAREAIIRDLGGDPNAASAELTFPTTALDSIKAYRDAADPKAEADAAVVADVLQILDALISNVEVWAAERDVVAGVDQFVQSAIDLTATNYVRLRWPRFFLILQSAATLQEMTATYGAGSNSLFRLGTSLKTLFEFLFNPGRGLEQLKTNPLADPDLPSVFDNYGINHRTVDGIFRLGATVLGYMHVNQTWKDITGDVLAGWDTPGLDIDSTEPPRAADIVSNQMVSFSFFPEDAEFEGAAEDAKPLFVSLAYVPKLLPATGLFVSVGGHLEKEVQLGERWTFTAKIRSDAAVAVLLGVPPRLPNPIDNSNFAASIGFASRPDPLTRLSFSLPRPTGSRLDIGQLAWSASLTSDGAETRASITDAALVVDGQDNDSFIRKLLGNKPLRQPFNLTVGYASGRGRILEGGLSSGAVSPAPGTSEETPPAPGTAQRTALTGDQPVGGDAIDVTIPVGRRVGPVTLIELTLRVSRTAPVPDAEPTVTAVEVGTSFSVVTGSVFFRLDRLRLALTLDASKPPAESNLRFIDAHLGISPPLGIAVQVDTSLVSGGGSIYHDPATGTYFGVLALRIGSKFTLKAFGLVATKNADGTPGSSFIIIGTLEGLGWQLGPVTIDGLGLLVARDRTFDENAVRAALPTGQLKHLLFPTDPVHHTTEIMQALQTFFPAQEGRTLVGLLAKLFLGKKLMRLDLAFIFEWYPGDLVPDRLIVLGRLSSVLPTDDVRVVQLSLDAVGVFDFSGGTIALDAVLVDSKLMGRFPLTGAAAFRRVPGVRGFALAVGGFHPRFTPPPGFPAVPRVTVALTTGDNPKLILQGYVALTANTLQFGADASLYAAACGFSITGNVGFDVLIQFYPPHFLAEFRASVQLKRGSTNLFKVAVEGLLEGPFPLRVAGKATFEVLWWDVTVGFDRTLIKGDDIQPEIAPVDAQSEVVAALNDPRNWTAELPDAAALMVALRRDDRPDQILVHPMGTLQTQQGVAPLNLTRDIDRLGEARATGARRFVITAVDFGGANPTRRPVRNEFSPGQLFDMTDDERLAAPSFERMEAGVEFGDDSYAFARSAVVRSPFDYEDVVFDAEGKPVEEPEALPVDAPLVLTLAGLGAAARTRFRDAATRFASAPSPHAPVLRPVGYAVAGADGAATPAPTTTWATWAEAHHALSHDGFDPGAVVVLAAQEATP